MAQLKKKAQQPYFSIVIPTYQRPDHLSVCLQTLAQLDYPHDCFEVIVVDDGSKTPLTEVVASFGNRLEVTLIAQSHAGPAAARNTGAKRAKGTFLAFTDDDCMPKKDWLEKLAACFAKTPDQIIGGRTLNWVRNNSYSETSQFILDIVYAYYNSDPSNARFFASNNLAIRADHFRALGGFDPTFRTSEDREICDRWLQRGYRMAYAPEAVVYHAHALTLRSFWRQHFHYGCGAFRFHQTRARRGSGPLRPDSKFYLHCLRHALREKRYRTLLPILMLWQLANAAGFFWQMSRPGRKSARKTDRCCAQSANDPL